MEIILTLIAAFTFSLLWWLIRIFTKIEKESENMRIAREDEIIRLNNAIFYLKEISDRLSGHKRRKED